MREQQYADAIRARIDLAIKLEAECDAVRSALDAIRSGLDTLLRYAPDKIYGLRGQDEPPFMVGSHNGDHVALSEVRALVARCAPNREP